MTISVKNFFKNRQTYIKIKNSTEAHRTGIHNALFEIGRENVKHMKNLMLEKKTGALYKIKGEIHQASSEDEAPAILTGKLFKSIDYSVRSDSEMEFGDRKIPGEDPYAKYLEEGTTKMKKRSHIVRTARERHKDNRQALLHHVRIELNK